MPAQNPATSKQDVATPRDFLDAVERRWGKLDVDLAATEENATAPIFVTPEQDTFHVDWSEVFVDTNCWLNPEFKKIDPYAAKCAQHGPLMRRGRIFMLTPASNSTLWFIRNVHQKAMVISLHPRLTFVGHEQAFPKDLCLSIFAPGMHGYGVWYWKEGLR